MAAAEDRVYVNLERFHTENGVARLTYVVVSDRQTGAIIWTHIEGAGDESNAPGAAPLATEDKIIFSDHAENTYVALDRSTGALRWRVFGERGFFGPLTPPARVGDTLYGASADGTVRGLINGFGPNVGLVYSEMAKRGNSVYFFTTSQGFIYDWVSGASN